VESVVSSVQFNLLQSALIFFSFISMAELGSQRVKVGASSQKVCSVLVLI
jgi:hypothetical protein